MKINIEHPFKTNLNNEIIDFNQTDIFGRNVLMFLLDENYDLNKDDFYFIIKNINLNHLDNDNDNIITYIVKYSGKNNETFVDYIINNVETKLFNKKNKYDKYILNYVFEELYDEKLILNFIEKTDLSGTNNNNDSFLISYLNLLTYQKFNYSIFNKLIKNNTIELKNNFGENALILFLKNCIHMQTIDKITFNEIFAKLYNSSEKFIITYKDNNKNFQNKTYLYYCKKEIIELLDNNFLIEILNNHDYINYPEHFIKNFDCFKQLPNKYLINILNKVNYKKINVKDLLNLYNKKYDKEIIDIIKNKIIENFEFDVKLIDILFAFHNDNNHLKDLFNNFKNKDDCHLNIFLSFCFANKKEELVKELKNEILKILHNKNIELTYLLKFSTILNNKEIDKLKDIVKTFEVITFINSCQKSDFNINNDFLDYIIENLWFTKSNKNLIKNILKKDDEKKEILNYILLKKEKIKLEKEIQIKNKNKEKHKI